MKSWWKALARRCLREQPAIYLRLKVLVGQFRALRSAGLRRHTCWQARRRGEAAMAWRTLDLNSAGVGCFCISLLDCQDSATRRRVFQHHAQRHGWPVEFWPATDGRELEISDYPAWISPGGLRPSTSQLLDGGAVGLLCSMRRLYEHALLVGVDYLVVLEDDAIIHSGTQLAVPEKFDVVFFNDRMFATPDGRTHSGCGTDGYLLSKSGIEKMLKILEGANEPADLLMIMQLRSSLDLGHPLSAFADPDKPLLAAYHSGPYVTHAEILPRVLPGRLR